MIIFIPYRGRCDRRMTVRYHTRGTTQVPDGTVALSDQPTRIALICPAQTPGNKARTPSLS